MNTISIQINGKQETVAAGVSVRDVLVSRGINPNVVACELNLQILKRSVLPTTILNEKDILEVIQMIGGG